MLESDDHGTLEIWGKTIAGSKNNFKVILKIWVGRLSNEKQ